MPQTLGGRYQIQQQLASGGFGQTYLAQDMHLPGQPVCVVKQLTAAFTRPKEIQTAQRLFDQEAATLYALGEHPQIPRLLAHFEQGRTFYLAQEFVQGQPLSELIVPGEPWPEDRVLSLVQDILQVLAFVHGKQVIHRDIKPANLLWRQVDERIVLIDFGAVKASQAVNTTVAANADGPLTVAIGTSGYMPVEQSSGRPKLNSDLYAAGMVALEALTGRAVMQLVAHPDTGEIDWRQYAPQTSTDFADFLDKMVRYDWRSRFKDADEALTALRQLSSRAQATGYIPTTILSQPTTTSEQPVPLPESSPANRSNPPGKTIADHKQGKVALIAAGAVGAIAFAGLAVNFVGAQINKLNYPTTSSLDDAASETSDISPSDLPDPPEPGLETLPDLDNPPDASSSEQSSVSDVLETAANVQVNVAEGYFGIGEYRKALETFEQAGETLGPGHPNVAWGRCRSLEALGQTQAALTACAGAAELDSTDFDTLFTAGRSLMNQDEYDKSLALFNLADTQRERGDDLQSVQLGQSMSLLGVGRYDDALATVDEDLEQNPDSAALWIMRSSVLIFQDERAAAIEAAEQALELDPNNPQAASALERAQNYQLDE